MSTVRRYDLSGKRKPRMSVLLIFLVLAFLLASAFWPFSGLTAWHFIFFLLLAIAVYIGFSRFILPLMFYFPILILYWVIAPISQTSAGVTFYVTNYKAPEFGIDALLFCAAHIFGVLVGVLLASTKKPKTVDLGADHISVSGAFLAFAVLVAAIIFVGYDSILRIRIEQESVDSTIRFIINFSKLMPAFIFSYFILSNRERLPPAISLLALAMIMLLMAVISNPFNTPRFLSLYGMLLVFLSYIIKSGRHGALSWLAAFTPLYAVVLLAFTSLMRLGLEEISIARMLLSLQSLEFSSYAVFIDALDVDFERTTFFLSHLFILVPRALWSDKEGSIGVFVAEQSGYIYNNVGLIAFYNPFADYGYLALIAFSALFGVLAVRLNPISQAPAFRNRRFVYGLVLTALTPMLVRGDLSTVVIALFSSVVAYEIVKLFTRFTFGSRGRAGK